MKKSIVIIAAMVAFLVVNSLVNGGILTSYRGSHNISAETYSTIEDSVNNAMETELNKLDNNDTATTEAKGIVRSATKAEMSLIKKIIVE